MAIESRGIYQYGLFIDNSTLDSIISKLKDKTDVQSFKNNIGLITYTDFIGEFVSLNGKMLDTELTFHFMPLYRQPTLYKTTYKNNDQVIEEIKTRLGFYLHPSFDYCTYIGELKGSYTYIV